MIRLIFMLFGLLSIISTAAAIAPADGDSRFSEIKRDIFNYYSGIMSERGDAPVAEKAQAQEPTSKICMVTPHGETVPVADYRVTDGDTIRIWGGEYENYPVRLMGIDAPEKSQPFGIDSQDNLEALLQRGGDVVVAAHGTARTSTTASSRTYAWAAIR